MKPIFKRRETNKIKKIIEDGVSMSAEDFLSKMDKVKQKINQLFDEHNHDDQEEN